MNVAESIIKRIKKMRALFLYIIVGFHMTNVSRIEVISFGIICAFDKKVKMRRPKRYYKFSFVLSFFFPISHL